VIQLELVDPVVIDAVAAQLQMLDLWPKA